MSANARKSSAVDTRPEPPEGNVGGRLQPRACRGPPRPATTGIPLHAQARELAEHGGDLDPTHVGAARRRAVPRARLAGLAHDGPPAGGAPVRTPTLASRWVVTDEAATQAIRPDRSKCPGRTVWSYRLEPRREGSIPVTPEAERGDRYSPNVVNVSSSAHDRQKLVTRPRRAFRCREAARPATSRLLTSEKAGRTDRRGGPATSGTATSRMRHDGTRRRPAAPSRFAAIREGCLSHLAKLLVDS